MINFNVFSSLLSNYTIKEYKKWKNKEYKTNKKLFENFYKDFKKPYSLLIGYGDNILNMLKIFNSNPGNFFFHRNILLLVTKYNKQNSLYPLLSFLEYEVCFLEIKNYFCKLNKKKIVIYCL